jgi:hypothetical protein
MGVAMKGILARGRHIYNKLQPLILYQKINTSSSIATNNCFDVVSFVEANKQTMPNCCLS